MLELLAKLPDESVLCTHGDILEATLALLVEAGMVIVGRPDYRKGATWVIERRDGQWTAAPKAPRPEGFVTRGSPAPARGRPSTEGRPSTRRSGAEENRRAASDVRGDGGAGALGSPRSR